MSQRATRILVVEDEAVVLYTLRLILEQNGFQVRGASNGAQALEMGLEFHPDILLCDINLPDANGIQISLQIKKSLPGCRVILLSGEISSADLLDDAKRNGHHFEVLPKPTDPEQLLRKLASRESHLHGDPTGIHRVK
jgi:CheY-like chemotaxis protein